jgi:hypothetical protein
MGDALVRMNHRTRETKYAGSAHVALALARPHAPSGHGMWHVGPATHRCRGIGETDGVGVQAVICG